ncbi:MAG: hypothetical protein U9R27_01200 [Campylobacterota bacterium]|nr:hypothetical protein [Campylobacterota bacterium]
MIKSIFEKIVLDTNANIALDYAHSDKYVKKREVSKKKKITPSIRKNKVVLKNLLG